MKQILWISLAFLWLCTACGKKETQKPNIVYILADDLGYGDLGVYGQEKIETPHIDALAKKGMLFTQHYSGAPVCAPSRCVLLTGKHMGNAYIRGNDEWGERGATNSFEAMYRDSTLEGQRPLPESELTIAQVLKDNGYATGVVGKWGLGAPHTDGIPTKRGFDYFCGYNCQRQAHTYYPYHLYENDRRIYINDKAVPPHKGFEKGVDVKERESYDVFTGEVYSPDVMHTKALEFMEKNSSQPFFLYYASPIPHVPLAAPQRWVDHYEKKFGKEEPCAHGGGYTPVYAPKATYAAMVSYLDEQVGEIVAKLKELGVYENTLIIFTSDNGPTFNGGTDSPWFNSGGPFKSERGWGKCFVHEGGIRVPMIASWPGHIKEGSTTDHISAFWDVFPTFCELINTKCSDELDGISFLPTLQGKQQKEHDYLYWEFHEVAGEQAVRMGKWKAIRTNIKKGNLDIHLFDLSNDIQELNDVADQYPEVVAQMKQIMEKEHTLPQLDRFKMKAIDGE
jgi:arylsulfatase